MGYRLHPDVAWRLVDGEVFLLTVDSRYHQIDDEVGVLVWTTLSAAPESAPPPLSELVARVVAGFAIDPATAEADLRAFLATLERVGAVEHVP